MSKEYSFSVMPSVSISRSRFVRKSQHKTSFNLGKIVPIYCDEVLPGDTRSIDMASLVRMSTPIAPIMDNIYLDFYAFYCPNRLLWDHWKEFMGENNESAGIPSQSYSVPFVADAEDQEDFVGLSIDELGDYLGLPLGTVYHTGLSGSTGAKVSALPGRMYFLVYNEWFRNQNVIAPYPVQTGDTNEILVGDIQNDIFGYSHGLLSASKLADYFTKALPYAQKGAAVTIPLGTTAPLIAGDLHSLGGKLLFTDPNSDDGALVTRTLPTAPYTKGIVSIDKGYSVVTAGGDITKTNLEVDLRNATSATINQLRYAFQLQKLLEKDALYGTRYWEILASHFGIMAPDASLQRPEYLGGWRQHINIDQVLSTAGYDDNSSTDLGKPGANSVTGGKSSIFTKSFTEHGYIMILAVARHDQTYHQGINRMWSRQNRFDFYFPVFANLGAQEIKKKEIYAQGTAVDDQVFGYQESWAEYRYKPSITTARLRPISGNLDFWTLGNNFGSLPTLGQTFIEQGRDNIQRALATGSSGPDFIADFYFEDIAVRPMPMYSIPGLIDHH